MTLYGDFIDIQKMPIEGGPLSDIRVSDFNQDSYSDLLLVSGDMNVLSMVYGSIDGMSGPSEFFSIEEAGAKEAQVFTALPVMSQGIYTGTVIAAGWDGYEPTLFMVEIGKGPQPDKPADKPSLSRLHPPPEHYHPNLRPPFYLFSWTRCVAHNRCTSPLLRAYEPIHPGSWPASANPIHPPYGSISRD